MKIKFNCDCEIEIVERLDHQCEPVFGLPETFKKGDKTEFDLIDHPVRWSAKEGKFVTDKNLWHVQFGDGTLGMSLSRSWFTILKED